MFGISRQVLESLEEEVEGGLSAGLGEGGNKQCLVVVQDPVWETKSEGCRFAASDEKKPPKSHSTSRNISQSRLADDTICLEGHNDGSTQVSARPLKAKTAGGLSQGRKRRRRSLSA